MPTPRLQDTDAFVLREFGDALRALDPANEAAHIAAIMAAQKRFREIGTSKADGEYMLRMVGRDVFAERIKAAEKLLAAVA